METAWYFLPKQPIKGKAKSIHFKFTYILMHFQVNTLDGHSTEKWTMAFAYLTKTHLMIYFENCFIPKRHFAKLALLQEVSSVLSSRPDLSLAD